jgi:lipopolysaccharide transport system permease protein
MKSHCMDMDKDAIGMSASPEIGDPQFTALPKEIDAEERWKTPIEPAPTRARPIKVIHPPSFSIGAIFTGLRTLAQYSDLLYTLTLFRLHVRYKQSALGCAWAALQPLALMLIYTIIFTRVTTVATGGIPYPVFVFCALLPWIFFSGTISNAVNGLVLHPNLLTKMYFPREIIPLSYMFAALVDFGIASILLVVLLKYYHVPLGWHLLYALPIVLILAGFAAAIALFFSAVQIRFRDVGLAMPFLLQVWMFTVPVVYSLQSVPVRFRSWYLLDPVAPLIESFRGLVIHGTTPKVGMLAFCGATTVAVLALTYAFFKSSEATMTDVI